MPMPTIEPYQMPTEGELPENVAQWRPDPARALLLVHDMQQYFVDAFVPDASPRKELIANIRVLKAVAADAGIPVAYTAQPGGMTRSQRGLLRDFWGPGMAREPSHRRIVAELAPEPRDTLLTKWRYSAFYRTGLRELLARIGRDQLIVCGLYAHLGCLMTTCDAFTMDIEPFFVADAVADLSPAEHRMALVYAARRCAMTISTEHLVRTLQPAAALERV